MMQDFRVEHPGQSPSVPLTPKAVRAPALFRGSNMADAAAMMARTRMAINRWVLIARVAVVGVAMETLSRRIL